jgi:F420-dependent oxidoreductase-like protein
MVPHLLYESVKKHSREDQNMHDSDSNTIRPYRDRIGLSVPTFNAAATLQTIVAAEEAGLAQVWAIQVPPAPDILSMFAAAVAQTATIRVGTSIVPTYPRHPLVMAQTALTLHDLAPGRFRMGIGPSHRPTIEGVYGLPMPSPLEHLREYVGVLRALLWEGRAEHEGHFYKLKAYLPRVPQTPILVSALREGAFRLAGEISDGAISWMCPPQYLLGKARSAMKEGAAEGGGRAGRPVPPLVAHVPVVLSEDRDAVHAAAHRNLDRYARLPFYAAMFENAGLPVTSDNTLSEELIDNLVVSGDEAIVAERLSALLESGLDELLVQSVAIEDADGELGRLMQVLGRL